MPLSPSQRRQVEDAETTIRKTVAEDITAAFDAIRNHSDTLKRVPRDILEGFTERAILVDEGARASWHGRADDPARAADALRNIAQQLEATVDRIHGSEECDDDGIDDADVQTAVAYVRNTAGISERVPSSLLEGVLIGALSRDAEASAAWDGRGENPTAINNVLKRVAHNLRPVADELVLMTRPSADRGGLDGVDVMNMSDKAWRDHKRKVAKANERR